MNDPVLQIERLQIFFDTEEGELCAVDGVNIELARGRIMALVGESGCGKSVTSYSILGLIQKPGRVAGGSIRFRPRQGKSLDLATLKEGDAELYRIRGNRIAMIFQEPMTSLSPVHTVGDQLTEAILTHEPVGMAEARRRVIEMMSRVGIPSPQRRFEQYPMEMSGGMRQRVVIAMALLCNPEVLIADEPTTALDVTIQAQIMGLLKSLQRDLGTSILLITHDLGVVAQMADDVAVMYLGRVVEQGPVREVLMRPAHPYTIGLLRSQPGLARDGRLRSIEGSVPSLTEIPPGCAFHPRCPHAQAGRCDVGHRPELIQFDGQHASACLRLDALPMLEAQHV